MRTSAGRRRHLVDPGESFDVLLQLTLPVALILAFVVVTEVRQLQKIIGEVNNTPPGLLTQEKKAAVLALQEQLLLKAVRQVFDEESNQFGVSVYPSLFPTPEQIASRTLPEKFTAATRALYDRFGTKKLFSSMTGEMGERAIQRFHAFVDTNSYPEIGDGAQDDLRNISAANESVLEKAVSGEMATLSRKAIEPQWALITQWVQSDAATNVSGDETKKAWGDFTSASEADKKTKGDRFRDLKVLELQKSLRDLNAPLFDEAVERVL